MSPRREPLAFAAVLAGLVAGFLHESLFGGKVLSPADVLFLSASFRERGSRVEYEPANRLLTDPVLQFQPWLEFSRSMIRRGRLPLWNDLAGCGAPHLANGQSAVFDPFHAIAYVGTLPGAHAWMAAARLWMAGLGMFLLARSWGLGPWGRWFAGLAFPFCGFLVVWLLFPVTSVAVWMPWLFWASDRVLSGPSPRRIGVLAVVVAFVLLGGHVQTGAHVLLAAGAYALGPVLLGLWRGSVDRGALRGYAGWAGGLGLGVLIAAVEVVPLGVYLTRSPVWADRVRELRPPWVLGRSRGLDAACTALPYLFGSQRRGHPNLARALGVHNLNESAGGFAGLATLVWLAPLAWSARRRRPHVCFLAGLVAFGACGAFGLPPVDNLLRAVPVVNVIDHRRLTLWVAFGLVLLGGVGLDELARPGRWARGRAWAPLGVAAALGLLAGAVAVARAEPVLRPRALAHYARAAAATPGADAGAYRQRAERQVRLTLDFVPRYLTLAAGQFLVLAGLAAAAGRGSRGPLVVRPALVGLTLLDLFAFGIGLNPAIEAADDRRVSPVIAHLRRTVGGSGRVLALGEELPPNTLMRHGLADVRNYDSVELARNLDWLAPLYEPGDSARTSRREVTWAGVLRAEGRLREAAVRAVVAPTPPPPGSFRRVDRVGAVWVARLDGEPLVSIGGRGAQAAAVARRDPGEIQIDWAEKGREKVIIRETFDAGWRAELDGRAVAVEPYRGTFLAVTAPPGVHRLVLRYDPPEVRVAAALSLSALGTAVFALTGFRPFRSTSNSGLGAWTDPNRRVRIGSVIFTGHSKRLTTEG